MPTYSLKCPQCQHKWTDFMWIKDREDAKCPLCGAKAENDYEADDGTVLIKGTGFYQEKKVR